jgi:GNAT superfamily N-acetyltransferase
MPELDPRIPGADRNFVASFEKLIGLRPGSEMHRIGGAVAWDSRIPIRYFNGVAVLEPPTTDDLRAALDWIMAREMPLTVFVRQDLLDASVEKTVLEVGLEPDEERSEPVMVIRPPAEVPEPPAGVSVREAFDEVTLEDHIQSTVAGGFPEDLTRQVFGPWWLDDPDVRMFTAYVDGTPAGNSLAIRSGDVSGVYSVAVPPEYRRRGIGASVTWGAVRAGREWGCELVALQSSPMGFGVYLGMGFEVLTRYAIFR